ncbi:hypothetical protein FRB90_005558, partial [Tulasnella sp. 427]
MNNSPDTSAGEAPVAALSFNTGQNPDRGPGADITESISRMRKDIIKLVGDIAWTGNSKNAAQDLQHAVEDFPILPDNATQSETELQEALGNLFKALVRVRARLEEAARKYGIKDKGIRHMIEHLAAHADRQGGIQLMESCRKDVRRATEQLRTTLRNGNPKDATSTAPVQTQQQQPADQEKNSNREAILSSAKTVFNAVETASGMIPIVGQYLAGAAKVGSTIIGMIEGMDGNQDLAKRLEAQVASLSGYLDHFQKPPREDQKEESSRRIQNLLEQLQDVDKDIKSINDQSAIKRAFRSAEDAEKLKQYLDTIRTTREELQLLVSLNTSSLVSEFRDAEKQREHRELLNVLGDGQYGAHGNSIEDASCLPGTRVQILERIDEWVRGEGGPEPGSTERKESGTMSNRVLWIRGMAGMGKSTIATTVAYRWALRGTYALFHFRRGKNAKDGLLSCALARQLGERGSPEVRNAILQAVRDHPSIIGERPEEQFATLLVNSMKNLPSTQQTSPILLIVDALDECSKISTAVKFVQLIAEYDSDLPLNIKFILTTRPEAPLLNELEPQKWRMETLDLTLKSEAYSDVELYLRSRLAKVKGGIRDLKVTEQWPPEESIRQLVEQSEGVFQWAHTAIEYIQHGKPVFRLDNLITGSGNRGLDALYGEILSQAFRNKDQSPNPNDLHLLHRSLSILVAAPHPISLDVLAYMVAPTEKMDSRHRKGPSADYLRSEIFLDVMSLVFVPESSSGEIQLMHTSIRDYLSDGRQKARPYFVDLSGLHCELARDCIRLMERDLRKNICNLTDLSFPNSHPDVQDAVTQHVPAGLIYCCRAWALHLTEGGRRNCPEDPIAMKTNDLMTFSTRKILQWVEVMSLTARLHEALQLAKKTQMWLKKLSDQSTDVATLWNDTPRWMAEFWEPIAFGALHIYASTIHFCPLTTRLWHHYHAGNVKPMYGRQPLYWNRSIWTVQERGGISSVAFSRDGKRIASGSSDGTVRLWDAETGQQSGEPLEGHTDPVASVAFSTDGKRIASGSWDGTVRLWDAETGQQSGEPLEGHTSGVTSVAFSPDGKRIASGSSDGTVRLWDAETGQQSGEPLEGHTDYVTSVAFSTDGKRIASGSWDRTVRLWDAETGQQSGEPLEGHTSPITSVVFSPDGKRIASGSSDGT